MGTDALLRLRLDLSYDGTAFSGWAEQPGLRTVAGELGCGLATLFRAPVPLVVAGRTDAGVHASGQVAHIDVVGDALRSLAPRRTAGHGTVPWLAHAESGDFAAGRYGLLRRLAGLLPPDVRVQGVRLAAAGFDARFSALRRHYRYRIATSTYGADPLRRFDTVGWHHQLDAESMAQAGARLLGLHDFAAYCKAREGASTIRDLQDLRVRRSADEPTVLLIEVTADAFCHSMVRSLVGALIAVGEGRTPVDRPGLLLAQRRRTSDVHVAPARGLTLVRVDYPSAVEMGLRAQETRAMRELPAPDSPGVV